MSDFAGQEFEFAVGSLKGLRAWNVDDKGRLHGVTHREVWRPGENVSICKKENTVPCPNPGAAPVDHLPKKAKASVESQPKKSKKKRHRDAWDESAIYNYYTSKDVTLTLYSTRNCADPVCSDGRHPVESGHRFDPSCECGFWAYDEASFTPQGQIIGVIDGYGKTTIGTKGFRAEKARLVAISRIDRDDKPLSQSLIFRLATLYPEIEIYDGLDELVEAHDGVLKNWADATGEEFWLTPVPQKDDSLWSFYKSAAMTYSLPSVSYARGGVV